MFPIGTIHPGYWSYLLVTLFIYVLWFSGHDTVLRYVCIAVFLL